MFFTILPPSSSVTLGRAELLTFPLMFQRGQVWEAHCDSFAAAELSTLPRQLMSLDLLLPPRSTAFTYKDQI